MPVLLCTQNHRAREQDGSSIHGIAGFQNSPRKIATLPPVDSTVPHIHKSPMQTLASRSPVVLDPLSHQHLGPFARNEGETEEKRPGSADSINGRMVVQADQRSFEEFQRKMRGTQLSKTCSEFVEVCNLFSCCTVSNSFPSETQDTE
jgi:hypothetical protein